MLTLEGIKLPNVIFVRPLLSQAQVFDFSIHFVVKILHLLSVSVILGLQGSCVLFSLILNVLVELCSDLREGLRVSSVFSLQISNVLSIALLHGILKFSYLGVVDVLKLRGIISTLLLGCLQVRRVSFAVCSHLGNVGITSRLEAGSLGLVKVHDHTNLSVVVLIDLVDLFDVDLLFRAMHVIQSLLISLMVSFERSNVTLKIVRLHGSLFGGICQLCLEGLVLFGLLSACNA